MTADDQLHTWKEVAHYLGRTVRTAQRWAKERGLPVHRLGHVNGPVFAIKQELEEWRRPATPASRSDELQLRGQVVLPLALAAGRYVIQITLRRR